MVGTAIGKEGTGRDEGPAAQTGTKTDENAEEVAAAAGKEGVNAETKREMEGMTRIGGRTRITTKTEELTGRGPGIRRVGGRQMTGDTKMTEKGTEKKERPNGRAGVEAGRGGTKVVEQMERRRAREGSVVTAERGTGIEMENSVLTNVVGAKSGAIISESLAMTRVNMNAEGVRALSKCHVRAISTSRVFFFPSLFLPNCLVCHSEERNVSTADIWNCLLWPM